MPPLKAAANPPAAGRADQSDAYNAASKSA